MAYSKVFGLGLSRTGTTSLHAAALLLGMSTIHYPVQFSRKWMSGDFSSDAIGPFIFYTDIPVPAYYREFDIACPNSKFILTIRNPEDWIVSIENHFSNTIPSSSKTFIRDNNRFVVYGETKFDRQKFVDVYNRHCDRVVKYFGNRVNTLLVLDIAKESDPWISLCNFLDIDTPSGNFLHLRSPNLGVLQFVLPTEVEHKRSILEGLLKRGTSKNS